jgi:aminoglycoside phosphotransferase (APT) family kinase protein
MKHREHAPRDRAWVNEQVARDVAELRAWLKNSNGRLPALARGMAPMHSTAKRPTFNPFQKRAAK